MSNNKLIAEVCWFDPKFGYGFLTIEGREDLFVHFSDIASEGFKTLKKGQKVECEIGKNNKNEDKAINVIVINGK
jgi:cold shock protein